MSHQVIKLMLNQRQRSVDQICLRRHVQSMKIWVFLGVSREDMVQASYIREEAEKWSGERRERQSNKDAQRYLDVCLVVVTKPNPLLDPRAARAAETTVGGFGEPSSFNSGRGDISSRDVEAAHHLFSYIILDDCTSQRCLLDSDKLNQCLWRRSGRGTGRPAAPVDGTIRSVMRAKLTTCDKWPTAVCQRLILRGRPRCRQLLLSEPPGLRWDTPAHTWRLRHCSYLSVLVTFRVTFLFISNMYIII